VVRAAAAFPAVRKVFVKAVNDKLSKAAEIVVAPVPPSAIAKVPVMLLASNFTANFADSITRPPLVFRSVDNVFPDFCNPSPAII